MTHPFLKTLSRTFFGTPYNFFLHGITNNILYYFNQQADQLLKEKNILV